jgi:monoamine oxidase
MAPEQNSEVIIVGAGIAGLYAGYLLKNEGKKVTLLEAAHRYGGRVRTSPQPPNSADLPLEEGAEYIHGQYSLIYNLLDYLKAPLVLLKGKLYIHFRGTLMSLKKAENDPHVMAASTFMEEQWKYKGPDISVKEYLKQQPFFIHTRDYLQTYAAELGTTLGRLGMYSLAVSERQWTAGHKLFKVKTGLTQSLDEFVQCLGEDLHLQQPVTGIDYTGKKVRVTTTNGIFTADTVIVTVPLTMLKKQCIFFNPELPEAKQKAIKTLGMDPILKVFLTFQEPFWKKKLYELYGGKLSPTYYVPWPGQQGQTPVLIAFLAGKKAEQFIQQQQQVNPLLQELNVLFGNDLPSKLFVSAKVVNWAQEPYIEGGYSYDTPNSEGMREILAQSLDNKVYFAGEATHYKGHHATMHGAMESAERAIAEILNFGTKV